MKTYLVLALVLVGCGGESSTRADAAMAGDAAVDSPGFDSCTGACQTTSLTADFAVTRVLNLAYYGVTASDGTLHVEAYLGGITSCPTMSSPTPDYQLVLGRVSMPASTAMSTSPGNVLDFEGDLLGGDLGQAATSVSIAPVAAQAGSFVALDVTATFPAGTISGHLYATHCDSLDAP